MDSWGDVIVVVGGVIILCLLNHYAPKGKSHVSTMDSIDDDTAGF